MRELDRKIVLTEGCEIKEARLDNQEILAEFSFIGNSYYVEGVKSHTRDYQWEEVRICENRRFDVVGYGKYKWLNGPWQIFDYADALRKAVISWLGKQADEKISNAIDSSYNCQEAMNKFVASWNSPNKEIEEAYEEKELPDAMPDEPIEVSSEPIEEIPAKVEENGIVSMINSLIVEEFEAFDDYNSVVSTLTIEDAEKYADIIKVLNDISTEEMVHVGELQELLKQLTSCAEKIKDGNKEAQETLKEISIEDSEEVEGTKEESLNKRYVKKKIGRA